MSQIHKGIFGSLAIALTLGAGAVQLAFAHDLIGGRQVTAAAPETGVNRAGKSDRASVPASPGQTQTITLRHDGVADTSVLVRMPVAKAARNETRNPAPTPPVTKPPPRKIAIACEPPVSVLTDVAKLLQPGRCVT
ncbi:hypothetical protein JQ609_22120 [Bradyrhizobium sp. AUGA SZCCT0169]|uniref:hypothetical protein n=1 Tax=unclassified Bradyrhizobium TaxID=2631580 RepID=UPI001BAAF6E2|nr:MULTISPECIES: hypothetical protein [unclassified Bradyrhizobium]MBR1192364.1 hypothetical protein [Bradyrhizobium sp. AUGA SZCCT0160]MBR1249613.1 hypothetical protein [Bradyrhizobium sp. AUGA SZCCT0169]